METLLALPELHCCGDVSLTCPPQTSPGGMLHLGREREDESVKQATHFGADRSAAARG